MAIKSIQADLWPEILWIQAEVYQDVEPETVEVLQSKWQQSPECCFVYLEDGQVLGYLLAHAWNSDEPPKLFSPLPPDSKGSILFLHDLAISVKAHGEGLGTTMIVQLCELARQHTFTQIRLVAVQDSLSFWQKQGLVALPKQPVCSSYGDGATLMWLQLAA